MTVTVPPPFAVAPAAELDDDDPPQPQANRITAANTSASPTRACAAGFPPGSARRLFCIVTAPSARSSGRPRLPVSAGPAANSHEVLLRFAVIRVDLPNPPHAGIPRRVPRHTQQDPPSRTVACVKRHTPVLMLLTGPIVKRHNDLSGSARAAMPNSRITAPNGGFRAPATYHQQSLRVIGMVGRRVPYRRVFALRSQAQSGVLEGKVGPSQSSTSVTRQSRMGLPAFVVPACCNTSHVRGFRAAAGRGGPGSP